MQQIIVEPQDLWWYMKTKIGQDGHGEMIYQIAGNDEYGIDIYAYEDDDYRIHILIESDGITVGDICVTDADEAEKTCSKVYENYLTDKVINILSGIRDAEDEEKALRELHKMIELDEIEDRESELSDTVLTFISDVLAIDGGIDDLDLDDVVEDCKDHFLEYLARKHGLDIYRPMVLEDENGEDFIAEYPYDCIIFDDASAFE